MKKYLEFFYKLSFLLILSITARAQVRTEPRILTIKVVNKQNINIADAKIEIVGLIDDGRLTDIDGKKRFDLTRKFKERNLKFGDDLRITVSKSGYISNVTFVTLKSSMQQSGEQQEQISLETVDQGFIYINGTVNQANSANPISLVKVSYLGDITDKNNITQTDDDGLFQLKINEFKISNNTVELLFLKKNYINEKITVDIKKGQNNIFVPIKLTPIIRTDSIVPTKITRLDSTKNRKLNKSNLNKNSSAITKNTITINAEILGYFYHWNDEYLHYSIGAGLSYYMNNKFSLGLSISGVSYDTRSSTLYKTVSGFQSHINISFQYNFVPINKYKLSPFIGAQTSVTLLNNQVYLGVTLPLGKNKVLDLKGGLSAYEVNVPERPLIGGVFLGVGLHVFTNWRLNSK